MRILMRAKMVKSCIVRIAVVFNELTNYCNWFSLLDLGSSASLGRNSLKLSPISVNFVLGFIIFLID